MGAFNQWVQGSYLERPDKRRTVTVAMNLLVGAAIITRANWLQVQGIDLNTAITGVRPLSPDEIDGAIGA
jgi:hypothetical protein